MSTLAVVTLGGISWEPEIRGLLTVALATALLCGTVWLLLVLNTGVRLGSMLALAGLFGWFTIMAIIWWLQGIGYTGDSPTWEYEGTFSDPPGAEITGIEDAYVGDVGELPDPNCETGRIFPVTEETGWTFTAPSYGCLPRAIGLVMHYSGPDRAEVIAEVATVDVDGIRARLLERNDLLEVEDPRYLDEADLEAKVAETAEAEANRIDNLTLSALAASAPQVIEWADALGYVDLGDWKLLSTAESGEAAASAEAFVNQREVFAFVPTTVEAADGTTEPSVSPLFVFEDAYEIGGKPEAGDGLWERVANKITNSARVTHPPHYAVVQARPAVPKAQVLGEAPPLPEPDRSGDTFSIVMVRNLGDLRLVPALIAIGSGLIFITLVLSLHWRDQRFRREQEAFESATA